MSLGERSSDICPPAACRWMEDVDLSAKTCLCPLSGNTKTVKCKSETQDVCFQRKSCTSALQPAWSKPDFKSFKDSLNVQPQIGRASSKHEAQLHIQTGHRHGGSAGNRQSMKHITDRCLSFGRRKESQEKLNVKLKQPLFFSIFILG